MIALLGWLLFLFGSLLFGTGTGTATYSVATVKGKPATVVKRGDVLGFEKPVRALVVTRLECPGDVHRIALHGAQSWHVPDLPEGPYEVRVNGRITYVVSQNHAAPCPK